MRLKTFTALSILVVAACLGAGCGERDPGASKETQQQSDRLTEIQKRTGGDWNKLTPEDKDYLVNTLAHGNEGTAKMLLGPSVPANPGQPRKAGE